MPKPAAPKAKKQAPHKKHKTTKSKRREHLQTVDAKAFDDPFSLANNSNMETLMRQSEHEDNVHVNQKLHEERRQR